MTGASTDTGAGDVPDDVWSVYLVRRSDGALYTGIARDVERRLGEHEQGGGRGAKALRGKGPLRLEYQRVIGDRALALRVEGRIKRLSKSRKEELLVRADAIDGLLDAARRSF